MGLFNPLVVLLLIHSLNFATAFNSAQCCNLAQSRNLFVNDPPAADISCGNVFINDSIPAAASLHVSYQFCKAECPGYDKSEWSSPGEWAAPIVQFLLPSIIFSMSIPRHVQFLSTDVLEEAWIKDATGPIARMAISLALLLPAMLCAALDTVIWVVLIMSMAGPMMVAGLHEATLDCKILRALIARDSKLFQGAGDEQLTTAVELLVTVVSGNLRLGDHDNPDPSSAIIEALTGKKVRIEGTVATPANGTPKPRAPPPPLRFSPSHIVHIPSRLTRLVTSQLPFGAIVGAPVVFYLGAFIYTVLDLLDNPSDQDRAISIAYGRVFPPVYAGAFGTVSMWRRGVNKRAWLERTRAWREVDGFRLQVAMGAWDWALVGVFTFVLISLPAAAGAFVSWRTPPVGFSCRSLSFVLYMGWEIVLTPVYFVWLEAREERGVVAWCWEVWLFLAFLVVFTMAVFTSIVLTLMQIIGVYRNCFCYVTTDYWFRLNEATVDVATDTLGQRNSSGGWIAVGNTATVFMAVCALLAWWFQRYIRGLYDLAIKRTVAGLVVQTPRSP
ncbi:hypothetical protein B0T18DRAFT_450924 [Schizothecium vesticola]|uniref:Uncharacterized protein n=1 Tax=Schizothecium vesticola TaxID=314040 RepID=A0AA40F7P4_9PEZI|nr:hypothetical protein B0T18DRAFT_450924 [Schizothecium vesticola]